MALLSLSMSSTWNDCFGQEAPGVAVVTASDASIGLQQPSGVGLKQPAATVSVETIDDQAVQFATDLSTPVVSDAKAAPQPTVVSNNSRSAPMSPLPLRVMSRSPQLQLRGQGLRMRSMARPAPQSTALNRWSKNSSQSTPSEKMPLRAKLASQSTPIEPVNQPQAIVSSAGSPDVKPQAVVLDQNPTQDDQELLTRYDQEWETAAHPPMPERPVVSQAATAAVLKSPAADTEPVALASATREAPGQQATHQQAPAWVGTLVEAHKLSQQAKTQAEYTEVAKLAAVALRNGAAGESAVFGRELVGWALNRRGELRSDEGQPDLASADFAAAIQSDPKCWRAIHNRGVSSAQAGDFASAFDDFAQVIRLNPQFAKAHSNRATLYVQAGKLDLAAADYESALKIDSSLTAAHVGLGRLHHARGNLTKALQHFDQALIGEDAAAEVFCSRADLNSDLGRYDAALTDYAKAVELNPEFAHAYRNGAWLLATCPDERFRDAQNALEGAQQALACGYGERHVALDTLAAAQANAGQFQQAVQTLKQAIAQAPQEAAASYHHRLARYQAGLPFRTQPIINGNHTDVQRADFRE
ncbi:MAG: tetratricopeptide repeat protein [Lacipirellulaceae bacterium]